MFSKALLDRPIAKVPKALERIAIAKERIQLILDRETVAHEKTLEQKIADQGPAGRRVDPHLISQAIFDLRELRRLALHHHPATGDKPWYSNLATSGEAVQARLAELAPLYDTISNVLSNVIGDALEVATFQALSTTSIASPRYHFDGHYFLDKPKKGGRFQQRKCANNIREKTTTKQPDFFLFGHDSGPLCIECKNYREWLYPQKTYIKHHILRCYELDVVPLFVVRRIHYSTITNFFEPAGIIAHESYHQYFPSDQHEIAERARFKGSLGFTDIMATEEPHKRTMHFFSELLPRVAAPMAKKWFLHRQALVDYANDEINLAQLYTAIGSRAGGKWVEQPEEPEPENPYDE